MTKPVATIKPRKSKSEASRNNAVKGASAPVNLNTSVSLPTYMSPAAKSAPQQPDYLPDSNTLLSAHQQSLSGSTLKSTSNAADTILAARSGSDGEVQFVEINTSVAGEEGSMQTHDTLVFDPTAAPADVLLTHKELNLPPVLGRTNPYPIQFYFKREISYADRKGRIVHMEFVSTMGFTTENWYSQAGVVLSNNTNQWSQLRFMKADEASATFLVDGSSLNQEQYLAFASADGASIAFDELYQALYSGGSEMKDFDLTLLLLPEMGVGYQFGALHNWLERVDHARWKAAHPDKAWYEQVGSFAWGLGKSVYNNTVGAVIQAGLQLADMERLWIAAQLKALGIADYTPSMWSDMGKAAEQGATTSDLLVGMGKGMVLAPYRFVKSVQQGDAEGAGEALGDTAFAIEGARGAVKAAPGIFRAGAKGLGKMRNWRAAIPSLKAGLRDFHMNLRGKGASALREFGDTPTNQYRHSMADANNSTGPHYSPPEVYGPISPEQVRLDKAHYDWIDQMHAATLGEGPEPARWNGPTPSLDAKGRWTGWDPAEAYAAYRAGIESNRGVFEVVIARDRMTGEYEVMVGDRGGVSPSANLNGRFWDTVMHYHPNLEAAPRYTLPAQKDMWTGMQSSLNAPLPEGRPHIEFVESTLNGRTTRVAIVMGGEAGVGRADLGAGVLGRDLAAGSQSITFNEGYFNFWRNQQGGTPLQSLPGDPLWVPPDTQAYRQMMIDAAEKLGHNTLAEEMKNAAPEDTGSPYAGRTQSGVVLDAVAPKKTLSQRELIDQAPPGSPYFSLKEFGLAPRFTNPIGNDEGADLASMRMVTRAEELRELMKKSRLAGGLSNNGQPLDPSQDRQGQAYWLVIQGEKGQLWLVPGYLLDKKTSAN